MVTGNRVFNSVLDTTERKELTFFFNLFFWFCSGVLLELKTQIFDYTANTGKTSSNKSQGHGSRAGCELRTGIYILHNLPFWEKL